MLINKFKNIHYHSVIRRIFKIRAVNWAYKYLKKQFIDEYQEICILLMTQVVEKYKNAIYLLRIVI